MDKKVIPNYKEIEAFKKQYPDDFNPNSKNRLSNRGIFVLGVAVLGLAY